MSYAARSWSARWRQSFQSMIAGAVGSAPSRTFSATVKAGINPSVVRSSGMNPTEPETSSVPLIACVSSRPASVRSNSRWPLPSMAAMPTISPPCHSNEELRTRTTSSSPVRASDNRRARTTPRGDTMTGADRSIGAAGTTSSAVSTGAASPSIARASVSAVWPARTPLETTRPRRSTVIRSADWSTSSSLWVMSTTSPPVAANARRPCSSCCTSRGASTALGSSSRRIRVWAASALTISSRWRSCTLSRSARTVGSSGNCSRSTSLAARRSAARPVSRHPAKRAMFSPTESAGTDVKC